MRHRIFLMATLSAVVALSSCSDDDNVQNPYFRLETDTYAVEIPAAGIAKSKLVPVTIRSNQAWTVTLADTADARWVSLYAEEGRDDGIFKFYVARNSAFTDRTAELQFVVGGRVQDQTITLHQAAEVPNVTIDNAASGYKALASGGVLKVPVKHNIDWTASLDASYDWLRIDSCGTDTVYLSLQPNNEDTRSATLVCSGTGEFAGRQSTTVITQADAGIYLNERFDWLNEGIEDYYYNYPEVAINKWTEAELSYGWTTLGAAMYGGRGYIKLGKTNYAGDVVLPPLKGITDKQDVTLTFKAIGYVSKAGAKDDGVLQVIVTGDGTLVGDVTDFTVGTQTLKSRTLQVTVFPNSANNENGADYDPWAQPAASFSVDIKGASANTRILIVGGAAYGASLTGVGQGKNRVLLDDFKVMKTSK